MWPSDQPKQHHMTCTFDNFPVPCTATMALDALHVCHKASGFGLASQILSMITTLTHSSNHVGCDTGGSGVLLVGQPQAAGGGVGGGCH